MSRAAQGISLKLGVFGLLLVPSASACGSEPEAQSGGDAYRSEAQQMPLDEWTTGEIDQDTGDTTDWKAIDVGEAGKLAVELKSESKGAVLQLGLYDKYGVELGSEKRRAGDEAIKLVVKAKSGRYFVKIAHRDGDKTAYSVRAVLGDDGGGRKTGPDL